MKPGIVLTLKSGDVFLQPFTKDQMVVGRILLNMQDVFCRLKMNCKSSYLSFFKDSYLVQGYENIFEPSKDKNSFSSNLRNLVSGVFMDDSGITNGHWKIVDHIPVQAHEIDFPAFFYNREGQIMCVRGEIEIDAKIDKEKYWKMNLMPVICSGPALKNYILDLLGKHECIHPVWRNKSNLGNFDLRFRENHMDIFEQSVRELITIDYYELAKKYKCSVSKLLID